MKLLNIASSIKRSTFQLHLYFMLYSLYELYIKKSYLKQHSATTEMKEREKLTQARNFFCQFFRMKQKKNEDKNFSDKNKFQQCER